MLSVTTKGLVNSSPFSFIISIILWGVINSPPVADKSTSEDSMNLPPDFKARATPYATSLHPLFSE